MKRFAFIVLALAIAVNANESIHDWAETFESDTTTVQECLDDAKTTIAEITETENKMKSIKDGTEIDEESKEVFVKYNSFIACILEKKDLIQDSKLDLDKILALAEKEKDLSEIKEVLTQCINSLNENSDMTREDRAFGLMLCIVSEHER